MADEVRVLGSMATRALVAELAAAWDWPARAEAVGGVEAARRARAGDAADILVLATAPMAALEAEGVLVRGSLRPLAVSDMAVAVRSGEALPDLSAPEAARSLRAAGRIGYSTGPSGEHLLSALQDLGVLDAVHLIQAPPGVPVGQLLADGAADLGFQQQNELATIPGLNVAVLAPPLGKRTTFAAGIMRRSERAAAAAALIDYFCRFPDTIRRHGLNTL